MLGDNEWGLWFTPGDAAGLASRLERFIGNDELRAPLASKAADFARTARVFESPINMTGGFPVSAQLQRLTCLQLSNSPGNLPAEDTKQLGPFLSPTGASNDWQEDV